MISILFISDDARAAELLALLQPHCRVRMRLSADFDEGLKEVFDNRPAAVFIQNSISGISGETVARHIKTLLRGDAPRIVLAHRANLTLQGGKKWFDDTFDFALPEQELLTAFKKQVVAIAPEQWQESVVPDESAPAAAAPAGTGEDPPPPPAAFDFFDWEPSPITVVAEPPPAAAFPQSVSEPPEPAAIPAPAPADEPEAAAAAISFDPEVAAMPLPESPVQPAMPLVEPPKSFIPPVAEEAAETFAVPGPAAAVSLSPAALGPPTAAPAAVPEPPVEWVAIPSPESGVGPRQGSRLSLWLPLALLGVAAIAGGALLFLRTPASRTAPPAGKSSTVATVPAPPSVKAVQPATPAAAPVRRTGLPSFVPASGRDPGFAKAHPGWERYLGKTLEFRLFREHGALRAVQVIGRHGRAIPEAFVATISGELAGSAIRTGVARQRQSGYLVERGRVGAQGEIAVYRKKNGAIRGVVVTLP